VNSKKSLLKHFCPSTSRLGNGTTIVSQSGGEREKTSPLLRTFRNHRDDQRKTQKEGENWKKRDECAETLTEVE